MTAAQKAPLLHFAKPNTVIVSIDPATARRWLDRNGHNRSVRPNIWKAYARDMLAGQWQLTGESIKFAIDGTLIDGQHRLRALIESGCTITMFVTRNLDIESQTAMDTGAKRTAADAINIGGGTSATCLASAARLAIPVELGLIDQIGRYPATHAEILRFIEENPDLPDAAHFGIQVARRTDCPPAVVAYTYWRLSQIDAPTAAQFWVDASEKVGLSAGDPVIALTNRFAESRRNRQSISKPLYLSLIYRAWNVRRKGQTMRFIRVNSPAGGLVPLVEPR